MVQGTVLLKNGDMETVTVNGFDELFDRYKDKDVAAISGKVIRLQDMRQGRETQNEAVRD